MEIMVDQNANGQTEFSKGEMTINNMVEHDIGAYYYKKRGTMAIGKNIVDNNDINNNINTHINNDKDKESLGYIFQHPSNTFPLVEKFNILMDSPDFC